MPPDPRIRPAGHASGLQDHGVVFLVIGGVGARLHGSPTLTQDMDLTPERSPPNLQRLADALNEMRPLKIHPRFRTPHPHEVTAQELASESIGSYLTRWGRIDVLLEPIGVGGYERLQARSIAYDVGDGLTVFVASLDDIIASKQASNRPKDQADLPRLVALREELDREP